MAIVKKIGDSFLIQAILILATYTFYAAILGIIIIPSIYLLLSVFRNMLLPGFSSNILPMGKVALFSLAVGISLFLFFITGLLVMSLFIRLLSLGIKACSYPPVSATTIRWLIYSGIYTLTVRMILPVIPMTFFCDLFFRIIGCKMGKNVHLNTRMLNDAYLLEIGDNVVIGGATDISCHTFEDNQLKLKEIKIGADILIDAHCYISPGVTIDRNCLIGLNSYIRQDKTIPDNTRITYIAAMEMRDAYRIEKQKSFK